MLFHIFKVVSFMFNSRCWGESLLHSRNYIILENKVDLTKDTITTKTKLFYGIGLLATTLFTGLVNGSHYIFYIDYMFLHPFGYIIISIFFQSIGLIQSLFRQVHAQILLRHGRKMSFGMFR